MKVDQAECIMQFGGLHHSIICAMLQAQIGHRGGYIMKSKVIVARQDYPAYLERRLEEMARQGSGSFTLNDLSRHSGLPITPNMRRRIKQLVYSNALIIPAYINQKRGVERVYVFNEGCW